MGLEHNNKELLLRLLKSGRVEDLYKLCRFTYRVGEPLVSDEFYNKIEQLVIQNGLSELTRQSYDDDEVPIDLLEEFGLGHLNYQAGGDSRFINYLDSEKSMSIKAIENYKDAFEYFSNTRNHRKIITPKLNGINLKSLFINENNEDLHNYVLGMTRGRSTHGMDVTTLMSRIVPKRIKGNREHVVVYGEGILEEEWVDKIPRKNYETFTSARMAAISMLRVKVPDEYYKHLHYYTFNADGVADTISETLDTLKTHGFDTVPYHMIEVDEVPKDFDTFCKWLKAKMDLVWADVQAMGLDSDGMVVDIDDKNYVGDVTNQYSSRNCALKFEYWAYDYYIATVSGLKIEQQRVNASVIITIDPLRSRDGSRNTKLPGYNLDIVIDNGIKVGSKLYFERNSGAIPVPIFGDKLKKLLGQDRSNLEHSSSFGGGTCTTT